MKRRDFLIKIGSFLGVGSLPFLVNGCGTGTAEIPEATPIPNTLFYYDIDGYKKELLPNATISPNIKKLRIYMISRNSEIKVFDSNNDLVNIRTKWLDGADNDVAAEVYFKDKLKYGETYTIKYMGSDDTFVMVGNTMLSNPMFKSSFNITPLELDRNILNIKLNEEQIVQAIKLYKQKEEFDSVRIISVKDSGFKYIDLKGNDVNGKVDALIKDENKIIIKGKKKGKVLLEIIGSTEKLKDAKAFIFVNIN